MSFSSILFQLSDSLLSGNGSTQSSEPTCENKIDFYLFYQLLVVPSVLEIGIMSLFVTRKRMCLHVCKGRPGVVTPMNIFEMENRFSFACAFGMIAYLIYQVVLESKYVIPFSGHVGYRVFVILLSVVVYGLAYFPIFAALAMKNILSYGLGCLHVWVFTAIGFYDTFYCAEILGVSLQFQTLARDLPLLFCLVYLSIMLPVRFVKAIFTEIKKSKIEVAEKKSIEEEIKLLRESRYGRHIQKNFLPPPPLPPPIEGVKGKIINILRPLLLPWIYRRNPEFLYSARFLSVLLVSSMLVYKLTVELLILFVNYMLILLGYIEQSLTYIGWTATPGESVEITSVRSYLFLIYYFTYSIFVVAITATCVECVLSALILVHLTSSYRKYLLGLHKGDTVHIPPISEKSNVSLLLGSMRWAGYQVGYVAWAYLIQWFILFLIFFGVATVITLFQAGYGYLIIGLIERLWPIPVVTIATIILQMLLVKFLFAQQRGEMLGIENRRWFFVTTHFFFFYNIFLGLISCLLRIIKAVVIGALFLGRLDHSTLPRRFQLFDPGFDAYVGFLHVENAHMHPVVIMFIKVLNLYIPPRYQVEETDDIKNNEDSELGEISAEPNADSKELRKKRARIRWQLAYMLYLNPYLKLTRKHYLKYLKEKLGKDKRTEDELQFAIKSKKEIELKIMDSNKEINGHVPKKTTINA